MSVVHAGSFFECNPGPTEAHQVLTCQAGNWKAGQLSEQFGKPGVHSGPWGPLKISRSKQPSDYILRR